MIIPIQQVPFQIVGNLLMKRNTQQQRVKISKWWQFKPSRSENIVKAHPSCRLSPQLCCLINWERRRHFFLSVERNPNFISNMLSSTRFTSCSCLSCLVNDKLGLECQLCSHHVHCRLGKCFGCYVMLSLDNMPKKKEKNMFFISKKILKIQIFRLEVGALCWH